MRFIKNSDHIPPIKEYCLVSKTGTELSVLNHGVTISALKIPVDEKQINHAFVFNPENDLATELFSSRTCLQMEVFSDQPCVQFYVGGQVDSILNSKGNLIYYKTSGIRFETHCFSDSPNHDHFLSCILKKDRCISSTPNFSFFI